MSKSKLFDYDKMHQYDDIIGLPHHVSETHPRMSLRDRAAQFAPFAALSGHHEAVKEAARLTEERTEQDEYLRAELDEKLQRILQQDQPVSITCFVPDAVKSGGKYVTLTGSIKRVDEYARTIVLTDGRRIPLDDVCGLSPV